MEIYVVQESRFLTYDDGERLKQTGISHFSCHELAIDFCSQRKKEIENETPHKNLERVWLEIIRYEIDKPAMKPKGLYWYSLNFKEKKRKRK